MFHADERACLFDWITWSAYDGAHDLKELVESSRRKRSEHGGAWYW